MEAVEVSALRQEMQQSLQAARQSRADGNEGRARVQARILAGKAVEVYALAKSPDTHPHRSAYAWLKWLASRENFPNRITGAAQRLTVRVTKTFELPHPEDPLEDAWMIVEDMLHRLG